MASNIRFIGIDQSFTSSGYVVMDEQTNIVDFGRIVTSEKNGDIFDRAHVTASVIGTLYLAHLPQYVGLEGLAFSKMGDATRDLAGLQFTIVNHLRYTIKCPREKIIIVSPNEVKKFATGKGNSKKEAMVDSLPTDVVKLFEQRNYKKTTGLTDITDAYWITRLMIDFYQKRK